MYFSYGLLLNTLQRLKPIKYTYTLFQPWQQSISTKDELYLSGSSLPPVYD